VVGRRPTAAWEPLHRRDVADAGARRIEGDVPGGDGGDARLARMARAIEQQAAVRAEQHRPLPRIGRQAERREGARGIEDQRQRRGQVHDTRLQEGRELWGEKSDVKIS
jgi:hypothetical protein